MWSNRLPLAPLVGAILLVAAPLVVPSWILFILTLALAKFMVVLAVALFLRAGLVFFAMLNLAFSMILYAALLKLYWVTGGTDGIGVRTPTFFGFILPRAIVRMSYYYFALVL